MANVCLTVDEETGQNEEVKRKRWTADGQRRKEIGPSVRGKCKEGREVRGKAHAQTGTTGREMEAGASLR